MYFDLKKKEFCFFKGPMENAHTYIYICTSMNDLETFNIFDICNHRKQKERLRLADGHDTHGNALQKWYRFKR